MRKLASDKIFDGYRWQHDKVIILRDDNIIADIIAKDQAGDDVEYYAGLLVPGMINAHCHLELSHLQNIISPHSGLINFLTFVTQNRNNDDEEKIIAGAKNADATMYANGISAAGDIANELITADIKKASKIYYHTFVECIGFTERKAPERLAYSQNIKQHFIKNNLAASIAPHAPYSVSEKLFHLINNLPSNYLLTIHNQESAAENEWYENKRGDFLRLYEMLKIDTDFFNASGKSSLRTYLPYFTRRQQIILVHNTFTKEEDIFFAQQLPLKIYWCLCPNANYYIEKKLPDISLLRKLNCSIVLGTDSLASNRQLSIVEEIKMILQFYPEISLEEVLQWATINGARALQADNKLGSFEKGKQPGVVWIKNYEKENWINNKIEVTRLI